MSTRTGDRDLLTAPTRTNSGGSGSCGGGTPLASLVCRSDAGRDPRDRSVVEQQKAEHQHEIVQERVVRRRDDADLERGHDARSTRGERAAA